MNFQFASFQNKHNIWKSKQSADKRRWQIEFDACQRWCYDRLQGRLQWHLHIVVNAGDGKAYGPTASPSLPDIDEVSITKSRWSQSAHAHTLAIWIVNKLVRETLIESWLQVQSDDIQTFAWFTKRVSRIKLNREGIWRERQMEANSEYWRSTFEIQTFNQERSTGGWHN